MGKELPLGSKLGPYTIERVVARTGLCEAYQALGQALAASDAPAKDSPSGNEGTTAREVRPCRVTVFHVDPAGEPWRRYERECQALKALGHPCIAELRELGTTPDGAPYVVHTLTAGEDLAARLRRAGALTTREALGLARQVGAALHAAHGIEQLHRDLQPEHLHLCPPPPPESGAEPGFERVLVLGFGQSRLLEGEVDGALLIGRAEYMAPEQINGFSIEVGPAADQYTLALILYQALTASQPFRGDSVGASLLKVVRTSPEPLRALRPDIPGHIEAAIMRALSKDRTVRFPDLPAFLAALQGDEPIAPGLGELTDPWLKSGGSTEAARQRALAIDGAAPSLQNVVAGLQAMEPVPVVIEDQATVPNTMEDVMNLAVPPVKLRVVELSPPPDSARVRAPAKTPPSGARESSGRISNPTLDSEPEILPASGPVAAAAPAPAAPLARHKVQHSGISEEKTSPDQPRGPVLKAAAEAARAASPAPIPATPAATPTPTPRATSPLAPLLPSALSPYAGIVERVLLVLLGLVLGFLLGGRSGH